MWSFQRMAADLLGGGGDRSPGSGAGSGGGGDTFSRSYSCYPVSFVDREALEEGNKILLPQSALNTLARMNVSWPILFSLTNPARSRTTHVGVLEFSAEEGTCFVPYWVMRNLLLKEGDIVSVRNVALPKGTYVKLQPVSKEFLDVSDHRALLEHCLRNYAALTKGDFILIKHGSKSFEIEILECAPADAVSVIETDVQVDFAPPLDYVEPPPPAPAVAGPTAAAPAAAAGDAAAGTGASEKLWLSPLRIPGGVRTTSAEYDRACHGGRRPGMIGKVRRAAGGADDGSGAHLFQGKGHSAR